MDGPTNPQSVRTGSDDPSIREILLAQSATLRVITEQLAALTKTLTPAPKDGPSLDEMFTAMVGLLREHAVVLTRVDERTMALGVDLPPLIAREIARTERDRDLHS